MRRVLLLPIILAVALLGCESPIGPTPPAMETLPESVTVPLPADVINDILRDSEFQYDLYAPVRLVLNISSLDEPESRSVSEQLFVVQLTDANNTVLYSGSVEPDTTLETEVLVPSDLPEMKLTVDSSGHEKREVVIEEPAKFAELNREMTTKVQRKGISDRDFDGIDDVYDAFPDDPALAFTRRIPASDSLRIAFEDNFPDLGDGDYNDFVADYRIMEFRSAKNALVSIEGSATAVARGAGYDHEFGIVVDNPELTGNVVIERFDGAGVLTSTTSFEAVDTARLILFPSTKAAFDRVGGGVSNDNVNPGDDPSIGHTTTFTITYVDTWEPTTVDNPVPYNPYLLIDNPSLDYRPDVHLLGSAPLADSQNPPEFKDFRDENGFPRALLVPDDWMPPTERTHIETAYPDFVIWRESMGVERSDWYFFPDETKVCPIL